MKFCNRDWSTYELRFLTVAVVCVFLAWTAVAKADILLSSCDGTGGVSQVQSISSEPSSTEFNLNITANQSGAGGLSVNFSTDPPADPLLMWGVAVSNTSAVAWSNYQVNVTLAVPNQLSGGCSITNETVYIPGAGWTVTGPSSLSFAGIDVLGDYDYTASLTMTGSPPVAPGGTLEYGFWLDFGAEPNFSVSAAMPLIVGTVPEPGTIALAYRAA